MEHLLGTRHYAKGWRRESHGQSDLMPCMTEENKGDRGACGFPRRSLLIREGVDLGQMENAGNSIPGRERHWQSLEEWQGHHISGREMLLAPGVCSVVWAWVSCPACWAQDFGLEHGSRVLECP